MTDNTKGAFLMMASMLAFVLNDLCIKATGGTVPLFQLLLLRGLLSTSLIFLLAWRLGALRFNLPGSDHGLIVLRSASEIAAAYFFLTALFHMPLANVTALLQLLPLTVTLGGALVFRERIGWRRLLAILIGFVGMLLIVRPGTDGFTQYTIYALISVACVTVRDLATRRMSGAVPSMFVTLSAAASVTLFSGIAMLGEPWVTPTPTQYALIVSSAFFIIGGYLFSVMVMRVGELGFVTPFRYTSLVWALLLGWLVFGEWPHILTLVGATIIVATGIFTLYRERQLRRRAARA